MISNSLFSFDTIQLHPNIWMELCPILRQNWNQHSLAALCQKSLVRIRSPCLRQIPVPPSVHWSTYSH